MLTKSALAGFIFNIKFGNFMGSFPFTFNIKNSQLEPIPLRKRYKMFFFCLAFYLLLIYFTTLLMYYTFTNPKSLEWKMCFLIVSSGHIGSICISLFQMNLDDICNTTTVLLKFMTQFQRQFFEKAIESSMGKRLEIILRYGNWVAIFYPVAILCAYFQMYDVPPLPYGALPQNYKHISVAIIFAPITMWVSCNIWAMGIFWVNITVIFAHAFETIGKEIRFGRVSYRTSEITRSSEVVLQTITCLRLLFIRHEQIVRFALVPLQAVVTKSVLCTVYIIIKYFDSIDSMYLNTGLNYVIAVSVGWCVFLKSLDGISYSLNKNFFALNQFQTQNIHEMKYVTMYMKSCRIAHYRIGNISAVSKKSVPKYIISISRGTLKLLMNTL